MTGHLGENGKAVGIGRYASESGAKRRDVAWDAYFEKGLQVSGATTLGGNLTGKYLTGTRLQTTAATDLNAAAEKIAVLDGDGTVRYRTPAELLEDLGADYIVEQGTSDGWTYRKWASGVAECWGEVTVRASITDAIGAMYMKVTDYFSWPDALFSAAPKIVQATPITTAPLLPIIRGGDTTKNQFRMYLLYPERYENSINWVIGVEAKARWK